ncbi:hypothetical protein N7539_006173 [Penicillium diatomitis]|uniref:Non-canonical purine NTP pyrophosphatase n=1 Tax=Penicillium diatomitis TaxID=2819901 RepID=A0A9W9X2J8_9EURO|nr:uncharacterized protein N7539_006173 [Penicillium diatomitis]KAJ5482727.1 hypothetical protein N7539_006173 [Penicillium diatomitis]
MKACTFVTGNPNKVIEVNAILGNTIPIRTVALDLPEIQGSLEEIARDKCRRATMIVHPISLLWPQKTRNWKKDRPQANSITLGSFKVNGPVTVEDSALEFHAMGKLPGPYIKYFLETLGNDGLNTLLAPYEDKGADAEDYVYENLRSSSRVGSYLEFYNSVANRESGKGKIVPARGPPVFGWEPIFEFEGETLAEMAHEKKVCHVDYADSVHR